MAHFYTAFGENRYASGIKEARANHYLPSVTTIDKIIANPGLEIWKQSQVLEAALTLSRLEDETDKEFIKRVLRDSKEQAHKAAKFGNVIHKMAERYITSKPLFYHGQRDDVWTCFKPLKNWIDRNISIQEYGFFNNMGAETVLVSKYYAGKADFYGLTKEGLVILLDFKTTAITPKDIKRNGKLRKAKIYPSWGRQLAALYKIARKEGEVDIVVSVVISSNPDYPGVWIHSWGVDDLKKAYNEFRHALAIYKSVNNI